MKQCASDNALCLTVVGEQMANVLIYYLVANKLNLIYIFNTMIIFTE